MNVTAKELLMLSSPDFDGDIPPVVSDYELVLVGHSLGAGTCSLLSLQLRKEWSSLKVFAYSCPACMTPALADICKEFIVSLTVGKDVVSRLSTRSVLKLREDIFSLSTRRLYSYKIAGVFHIF